MVDNDMRTKDPPIIRLPLEILQWIFWHMEVGTFFAVQLVCKRFLQSSKSKSLLLRQVRRLPGLTLGLESLTNKELLRRFRKRAKQSGCAANVFANVSIYNPTSKVPLTRAAFSSDSRFFASVHDGAIIHVFSLYSDQVRHEIELHIRPEDSNDCRMEVLFLSFSSSQDLVVLYKHQKSSRPSIFNYDYSQKFTTYKLVTFHRCFAQQKNHFYTSTQQETRDIQIDSTFEPKNLAMALNGTAAIVLRSPKDTTSLLLVGRDEKLMEASTYDPEPQILTLREDNLASECLFHGVRLLDNGQAHLFKPGNPIYKWSLRSYEPCLGLPGTPIINRTFCSLDPQIEDFAEGFNIGLPFHFKHSKNTLIEGNDERVCQTSFLSLGVKESLSRTSGHPEVFIMLGKSDGISNCDHKVHMEDSLRMVAWDWTPLALLAGWRQGSNSLGTVLAISSKGCRIAAASWTRVLMWSLDPEMLHQGSLECYFPKRDFNARKGLGRLRPTMLFSYGVIHKMMWAGEDDLYATTDQGLVKWSMGGCCYKEVEHLSLTYDAWPQTALVTPAVPE